MGARVRFWLLTLQTTCDAIRSPVKMGGWVTLQEMPVAGTSSEKTTAES